MRSETNQASKVPVVDLCYRIHGQMLPVDHAYSLFSAISGPLPWVHSDTTIGIFPISGQITGNRQLSLDHDSHLTIRIPILQIPNALGLAGQGLKIDQSLIRVGTPTVRPLRPDKALYSRLVIIRGAIEPEDFLQAANRQLEQSGISGKLELVRRVRTTSLEGGKGSPDKYLRRTVRIADKNIVGYAVKVSNLTAQDSVKLQSLGLGGRAHFGCGLFVPAAEVVKNDENKTELTDSRA